MLLLLLILYIIAQSITEGRVVETTELGKRMSKAYLALVGTVSFSRLS